MRAMTSVGAFAVLTAWIILACPASQAQQMLKREPAMGAMKEGPRVLVDDGTCPNGQVKEVTGGNHTKVGGNKKLERIRKCIRRP